jgi:hypothetical protein
MPESRELAATYEIAVALGGELKEQGVELRLEKIEIDATDKEQKRFKKDHPARSGLPYEIDSKCTAMRGTDKAQSYVYPAMWRTSGKKRSEHSLAELALEGISYTHRALILELGPLCLMVFCFTSNLVPFSSLVGSTPNPHIGTMVSPFSLWVNNTDSP